jgi:hypothetical protein
MGPAATPDRAAHNLLCSTARVRRAFVCWTKTAQRHQIVVSEPCWIPRSISVSLISANVILFCLGPHEHGPVASQQRLAMAANFVWLRAVGLARRTSLIAADALTANRAAACRAELPCSAVLATFRRKIGPGNWLVLRQLVTQNCTVVRCVEIAETRQSTNQIVFRLRCLIYTSHDRC